MSSTERSPPASTKLTNVKIRHCLTMRPRAVLDADPDGHHVHAFSLHFSGYDRKKHDDGTLQLHPGQSR